MQRWTLTLAAAALCFGIVTAAPADHHETGAGAAEMPPMGPPEEMKIVEAMNGEYDVKFFYKMDPTSEEWVETAATATLSSVVAGGAQKMEFEGNMMGMPFQGVGLTSYDRYTQQWQMTWVDSMGARISMYTGSFDDGKMVVTGEDMGPDGATYKARLTTYNITDDGYDWLYELSMDGGATYIKGAKATYTRK